MSALLFRQFERAACHCAFYIIAFVQLQREGVQVWYLLIAALVSYILALMFAPTIKKLLPGRGRSDYAAAAISIATALIFFPVIFNSEYAKFEKSPLLVQGLALFPLAIYHSLSAVQLLSVSKSKVFALLPYAIGGILGLAIGIAFPNISYLRPLIVLFAINFLTNWNRAIYIRDNDPWG